MRRPRNASARTVVLAEQDLPLEQGPVDLLALRGGQRPREVDAADLGAEGHADGGQRERREVLGTAVRPVAREAAQVAAPLEEIEGGGREGSRSHHGHGAGFEDRGHVVVGLQQVDQALIEAARGMGMSARATLFRVELPLAVPVIVAGLRVALVLNVGNAVLASYIGGGGLGDIVVQSLTLSRTPVLIVSGTIIAALALLVDWLAGLVERIIVARSG